MPIYLPWLTIACAILSICGVICSISNFAYLPPYIALALILFGQVFKLGKKAYCLSLIPIIFCLYTDFSSKNHIHGLTQPLPAFSDLSSLIRKRMTNVHIRFLGECEGSLLASMVLGNKAINLNQNILQAFRKTGISHLVAASGFNLTIVVMVTYYMLRPFFQQRGMLTIISSANVLLYTALAGLSSSITRAAIACLIVLLARYYHRRLHSMAALSCGVIINLLIDPFAIVDIGAQLSYASVIGIMIGSRPIANILPAQNIFLKLISTSASVILAAQIFVLPVQLYYFWQIGLLFLPTNLLVDPLIAPLTIIGFIASFIAIVNLPITCFIAQALDLLAAIPLKAILFLTQQLATIDQAVIRTGQPFFLSILIYYCLLITALYYLKKKYCPCRLLSFLLFAAGLFILTYQPELNRSIFVLLPKSIIYINKQRHAVCTGEIDSCAQKILAYYATSTTKQERALNGRQINVEGNYFISTSKVNQNNKFCSISKKEFSAKLKDVEVIMRCPHYIYKFYRLSDLNHTFTD